MSKFAYLTLVVSMSLGSVTLHPLWAQNSSGCCEGTLFRWSVDYCETGGPDLSEPLVTDRPDFTEASSTVGLGIAQLEMGYTFATDDDGTATIDGHSWGEPLLRYGILRNWLEFRIAVLPVTEEIEQLGLRNETSGTEDLYLGFKIGLTPQAGHLPEMAIIPQMTVPTGSSAFSDDEVLPGLNWLYAWDISDCVSMAGSTQFNRAVDDTGEGYTEWAQSWTIGLSLTEQWGAYSEWYAFFPHSADTARTEHYYNGGLTFLISNDIQWDIRAGLGLNDNAVDFFAGTGLSVRFR